MTLRLACAGMANYKTHTKFNLFLALPILLGLGFYLLPLTLSQLALFAGAFTYSTLYMSPDVDLAYQIKFLSLRGLLTLPFRPYSWVFKHRGLSHTPIIGTLTRVIYLALIAFGILYFAYEFVPTKDGFIAFITLYQTPLILVLAGAAIADLCHLLLDL